MPEAKSMPIFRQPPITEVVCGIMFKPLKALLAPHLGLFWNSIRSEFPTCREVEPLVPVIESLDPAALEPSQELSLPLMPRVWFISKDSNGIVQIQRDRLLQNWRKVRPTDEYPHYTQVKEDFKKHLAAFSSFLAQNQLGSVELEQQELTYINHIHRGAGWETMSDLPKVFPDFSWRPGLRFLPEPEGIHWRTTFVLPERVGRLHVTIQNATQRSDGMPLFLVELTVRGIPKDKSVETMWQWFDLAREWIVRGFTDLTGQEMHSRWERQE